MFRLRPLVIGTVLTMVFGSVGPTRTLADEPQAAPAPAPDPEKAPALARAEALNNEMMDLQAKGKTADAISLAREILAIREAALGKDDVLVGASLSNLAQLLVARAGYAEARPLFERALAINEKVLGKDHLTTATSLNNLGSLLRVQGALSEARPLLERSLAVLEQQLGKDHVSVAGGLNSLAVLLYDQGEYPAARPLFERALAIRETALGRDHLLIATSLSNLAMLLDAMGAYGEVRVLYERALSIRERALGQDHQSVASSLSNLGTFLYVQGAYREALARFERALAIFERVLGREHPDVASVLNNMAQLHQAQGAYGEARPLYERALAIMETTFGKDHPSVAVSLNNLALMFKAQGDYAEARPLCERALAIMEAKLGKSHPSLATSLNNLASLRHAEGRDAEARLLYERVLAIRERALGPNHPAVAASLNNLAVFLRVQGAPAEARPLQERALAIDERALGTDHPTVAGDLINLAALLQMMGAYEDARGLDERALSIRRKVFGAHHPYVAAVLNNLAMILQAQGRAEEARPLQERALAITDIDARAQFSGLSARQRLALMRTTRYRLDNWVLLAPRVGLTGYPEVMRYRGLVARAEAAERIFSRRAGGGDRALLEALQVTQRRAAGLANEVPSSFKMEARATWQKAYGEVTAERERLTVELTRRSAPLRGVLERLDLGVADVQASLGLDTVLLDFLRVKDRYIAWVVRATGEPTRVDVGAADAVEKASTVFVDAVARGREASAAGAALRAIVWAPLASTMGDGVRRVVICPDAALGEVPFAALPGSAPSTLLLDEFSISYVLHAQDLVPRKDAPPTGTGTLLVGGVDYDHAEPGSAGEPIENSRGLATADRALRGEKFASIPETRAEVEGLRELLGRAGTVLLSDADATESAFRRAVVGKRLVHVATHGFSHEDLLAGLYVRQVETAFTADTERQLSVGHDPMLLSGLAMAGANPRVGAADDDGILTALEASYLDLDGVDLVILSACETARGIAQSGEGVQGLVSAFQMAGARGVIATLWRVDDEGTRRLMGDLYERMLRRSGGRAPAEALREAAIALRDWKDSSGRARFAAPRYWAAFAAYGM